MVFKVILYKRCQLLEFGFRRSLVLSCSLRAKRVLISALIQGAGGRLEQYDLDGAFKSKIWFRFVLIVDIFSRTSLIKKNLISESCKKSR